MDQQRQDDHTEPSYNISVPIQDIALNTNQERWTIEKRGGKGSGRFVLAAWHDDDDDDDDGEDRGNCVNLINIKVTPFVMTSLILKFIVNIKLRTLYKYTNTYIYIYIYMYVCMFHNPSEGAECDKKSIFSRV